MTRNLLGPIPITTHKHAPSCAEDLPFTVKVVKTDSDLQKAVEIRHKAYSRHVPDLGHLLSGPETADVEDGVAVLLAESKDDGKPVGTMRIQTNRYKPLNLEQSLPLPTSLSSARLAEATRLGVAEGRTGRMVTTAMFKAFYRYCCSHDVDWMVITARAPVDRQYERLLFNDVYPGIGYVPMKHVGNLPHRVMSFKVPDAQKLWIEAGHPLYGFVILTSHPDIEVGEKAVG